MTTAEHQVMEFYSVKDLLESQVEDQGKVKIKVAAKDLKISFISFLFPRSHTNK